MRIVMLRTRNFTPPEDRRISIKYREGCGYTVRRAWGAAMVADGDAREVRPPRRPAPPLPPEVNDPRQDPADDGGE